MKAPTNLDRSRERSQLWTIIPALIFALVLAVIIAPFAIEQLERFFPVAVNPGASPSSPQDNQPFPAVAETLNNDWPTPPPGLLAASGLVTVTVTPSPPQETPRPVPTLRALPTPSWQEISYLTSVKFTASTVVESERKTSIALLGDITTDTLLLKAVGNVLVGVDLSRVSNVQVTGRSIRLSLPLPDVISVELVPEQSQIYDRASVLFLSQYDGLETDALLQAQAQLRAEVSENESLMKLAQDMSRLQLTEFLENAGFRTVEIDFPAINVRNGRG